MAVDISVAAAVADIEPSVAVAAVAGKQQSLVAVVDIEHNSRCKYIWRRKIHYNMARK